MSRKRLEQVAENFSVALPAECEALADLCESLAVNEVDVRFAVLECCFRLTRDFYGDDHGPGVSNQFRLALIRLWESYLPGILEVEGPDEGTAMAQALRAELLALGSWEPQTYGFQ